MTVHVKKPTENGITKSTFQPIFPAINDINELEEDFDNNKNHHDDILFNKES